MSNPKTKVEIRKRVLQVEIIEVELPYYYEHNLESECGDSVIYGKIEEKVSTSIKEAKDYDGFVQYQIEREEHNSINDTGLWCYFNEEHKSYKEKFEAVKLRCLRFLNGI